MTDFPRKRGEGEVVPSVWAEHAPIGLLRR
jgi:hypothetical protein